MFRIASRVRNTSRFLSLKAAQGLSSVKSTLPLENEISEEIELSTETESPKAHEVKEEQLLKLNSREPQFVPETMIDETEGMFELFKLNNQI